TALDDNNDAVPGYSGTVQFVSGDSTSQLPPSTTLVSGTGSFSAVFNTIGTFTLTAMDAANGGIAGSSSPVSVFSQEEVKLLVQFASDTADETGTATANVATGHGVTLTGALSGAAPGDNVAIGLYKGDPEPDRVVHGIAVASGTIVIKGSDGEF